MRVKTHMRAGAKDPYARRRVSGLGKARRHEDAQFSRLIKDGRAKKSNYRPISILSDAEAYLESSQFSMMEPFCENSSRPVFSYFRKKAPW